MNATLDALLCTARHLGAKICGTEMCYLGDMSPDSEPQSPKMSLSLSGGPNINFIKKRAKL